MGRPISGSVWRTDDGHELPYVVDHTGEARILAALPPKPLFGGMPRWADHQPVIPRDQWEERDYSHFNAPILDQGNTGSCVGHGSATGQTRAMRMAGQSFIRLSACFIYGLINGGRDQGAVVSDAMDVLLRTGVCPESTVPEGMIYARQFPKSATVEAHDYRAGDCYHAATFDELASGIMMAWIPVYGIVVGDNFGDLDSEGACPATPTGSRGGHCLTGFGLKRRGAGEWAMKTQNSWSQRWGDSGTVAVPQSMFTYAASVYGGQLDAFLIRATLDPPRDPNNPPILTA
jgi:hypothetical protein